MVTRPLFNEPRVEDSKSKSYSEPIRDFLDRSTTLAAVSCRALINSWFDALPDATASAPRARSDLAVRLSDEDDLVFLAAFWELYLHASLKAQGFMLELDPPVRGTVSHPDRRPDFLVTSPDGESFYLEATRVKAIYPGRLPQPDRVARLRDYLDQRPDPNFLVHLNFKSTHNTDIPMKQLAHEIRLWLQTLDPDAQGSPAFVWEKNGWKIKVLATPKPVDVRGVKDDILVGSHMGGGGVDFAGPIEDALKEKAGRYGNLGRPYVIAVAIDSMPPIEGYVEEVLFGGTLSDETATPTRITQYVNGFFVPKEGRAFNTRVSAVLIGHRINPMTVATARPTLWRNPRGTQTHQLPALLWAERQMNLETRLSEQVQDGCDPRDLFQLGTDWPGPL